MATLTGVEFGSDNGPAFLDCIAFSEGTYKVGDRGYNCIVTSTPAKPVLFSDYSSHPKRLMTMIIKGNEVKSTAAGRYQLLYRYWVAYSKSLKLASFEPVNQDRIARQQMIERGALALLEKDDFYGALVACKNIWASFPGAGYNQHEQKIETLAAVYKAAGGVIAEQ